jgi:putative membrane protein
MAWTWSWRAYPGVWMFVALLALPAVLGRRTSLLGWRRVRWLLGCALLWASLDWPLGTLGAGYLLSAHSLQFLLIVYGAVPLVLTAVPADWIARLAVGPPAVRGLGRLTHPVVASVTLTAVVVISHLPTVIDTLRPTQLGSFGLDMTWVLAATLFWWPVIVPWPVRAWFGPPVRMLYLFLSGMSCVGIGIQLALTELPLYGLYELAPRVEAIPARADQQVAAMLMWVMAHLLSLAAISVVFFGWARRDEARLGPEPIGSSSAGS